MLDNERKLELEAKQRNIECHTKIAESVRGFRDGRRARLEAMYVLRGILRWVNAGRGLRLARLYADGRRE